MCILLFPLLLALAHLERAGSQPRPSGSALPSRRVSHRGLFPDGAGDSLRPCPRFSFTGDDCEDGGGGECGASDS
eukprot:2665221-Pyramimonas_sp.AAC.1